MAIVASDSMGVRSLATIVESSCGTLIAIDPGAALAPRRFGLPPHPVEQARLEEALGEIRRWLREAHVIVITHYHFDHYMYRKGDEELHKGKVLAVKHPENAINVSQRLRAHRFLRKQGVAELVSRLVYADGTTLEFEDVKLVFSPPVPHGRPGTPLGYVTMVCIEVDGVRIVHASDVQGPGSREALEWIKSVNPDLVIMSGPPLYMEGVKLDESEVRDSVAYLAELVKSLKRGSTLIIDHHTLRDINYREKLSNIYNMARERGVNVLTAAEFMGRPIEQLEALRKELWSKEGL